MGSILIFRYMGDFWNLFMIFDFSIFVGKLIPHFAQWEIGWKKVKDVILPEFVFTFFIRQSIPQLRKNHTMKPLATLHISGTCLQSQNFRDNIFFVSEMSTLEPNISRSVQYLFSIYILIRKVFESAFQQYI
jgi:hypothetical protein